MGTKLNISNIIKFIVDGDERQAFEDWKSQLERQNKCTPCYYSPMHESVRCASCLESYLTLAELQRLHGDKDQLSQARLGINFWIKSFQESA